MNAMAFLVSSTDRLARLEEEEEEEEGMNNNGRSRGEDDDDDRGLLWKIPEVKSRQLGRLGPGFGFGFGLLGDAVFGPGIPGLQLGFGLGFGCGVGVGRGVAYVENWKYSIVGKFFHGPGNFPTHDEVGALVDDIIINTKKLIEATSREVDKWRR